MEVTSNAPRPTAESFLNPEATKITTGKQELGSDDFLKLLTTQLTTQDPMKPMEDTQFISQMANFTSLEQMRTLSKDFAAFSASQRISTAQEFLGKTVTISNDDGLVNGLVTEINVVDGEPRLTINGQQYDPADVSNVRVTPTAVVNASPTQTTPTP